MKILIIRLSAIGDTIHSLPVAAALKRSLPGLELSWLVEPLSEPLLRNNPAVDKVYVLQKQEWLSNLFTVTGGKPNGAVGFFKLVQQLRAQKFDIALDLQGLFKSAVFLSFSNAVRRIGLSDTREGARFFIKEAVDVGDWFAPDIHIVDRGLAVANYIIETIHPAAAHTNVVEFPLPCPQQRSKLLAQSIWSKQSADESSNTTGLGRAPRKVVLVAGGTWSTKLWAAEKWCELLLQLSKTCDFELCLIGAARERKLNSFVFSFLRKNAPTVQVTNLTGSTDLLDLIAIFQSADLVVGADTGPLHLAAATGHTAVVGVYGSTPRIRNGPYGPNCFTVALDLWCQPCSQKKCPLGTTACLEDLPVDNVLKIVNQALETMPDACMR